MNPLLQRFLLAALLLVEAGTAWGQAVEKPTIRMATTAVFTFTPTADTSSLNVGSDNGGPISKFTVLCRYELTGNPMPYEAGGSLSLTSTSNVKPRESMWSKWCLTFTTNDIGKHVYTITATNLAGVASTTFTVNVLSSQEAIKPTNRVRGLRWVNLRDPSTWYSVRTNRTATGVVAPANAVNAQQPSRQVQRVNLRRPSSGN